MRLIFAAIGSFLLLFWFVLLVCGKKYSEKVNRVNDKNFPGARLYIVGFALSHGLFNKTNERKGIFKPSSLTNKKIREVTNLLYGIPYGFEWRDYYAELIWAGTLTYVYITLTTFFLSFAVTGVGISSEIELAKTVFSVFATVIGLVFAFKVYSSGFEKVKKIKDDCKSEIADISLKFTLLCSTGMIMRDVWEKIAYSGEGQAYLYMREAIDNMNNTGASLSNEILLFGKKTDSMEIKKFCTSLIQAEERGSAALTEFLTAQTTEMWSKKRQYMLQKGEKAAGALLGPTAVMLISVVVVIMASAFGGGMGI